MYRKGSRKKKKQFKVLKLSNLFFFVKIILHCTSILFIVRNLVWIVQGFFYSKILASLTCDCKTWYIYKCKAWSITWEHIMYIIQLSHTYNEVFQDRLQILTYKLFQAIRYFGLQGAFPIPNVPSSMTAYFKSPF